MFTTYYLSLCLGDGEIMLSLLLVLFYIVGYTAAAYSMFGQTQIDCGDEPCTWMYLTLFL